MAIGGGAITLATHLMARDYLTRQANQQLRSYANELNSRPFTLFPGSRVAPGAGGLGAAGSAVGIAVRAVNGQLLITAGPVIPAAASKDWLEVSEPISFQADHIPFVYGADDSSFVVASKTRPGYAGTLVIGLNLAGVGEAVDGLTVICLQVTGLAMLIATAAAAGITRWLARAAGPAAGTGAPSGEVTGRTSAAVAEACSQMRRPLNVLAGLAEYHRGRGELGHGEGERTMRRVAREADRMAELVDELEAAVRDAPSPKSAGR